MNLHKIGITLGAAYLIAASAGPAAKAHTDGSVPAAPIQSPVAAKRPIAAGTAAPSGNADATLSAGTPVVLTLDQTIKSNGTAEGDPVQFTVAFPVLSTDPSHVPFIARGAKAMGHVIVSSKRGYVGRRGDLQFQIDYVMDVAGKRVYLSDQCFGGRAADRGAESVAIAIAVSSAGLLIQGGDKKFSAGSQFTCYVDQDATLPPALPSGPPRPA